MTAIMTNACKHALLDSAVAAGLNPATPFLALHTGFPPAVNPGNEVTGGSPAYARKAITWQAAGAVTAGARDITAAVTFDVPATTVRAVSLVDAASGAATMRVWMPVGSSARRAFSVDAAGVTNNDFSSPAHGLVAGNSVLVWPTIGAALPTGTGLAEDTELFVIATGLTTDTFRLSTTLGGAAIDLTAIGDGDVQKFTPEVFAAQGTYQASAFTVSLPG